MSYSPSPRPTFDGPAHIPSEAVTRHLWGDAISGEVADWIYVSSDKIHQIIFGLLPGAWFRHSDAYRTVFAADEVLYVLSGILLINNPETGEVHRALPGEAVFFRRDTWHHAMNGSTEPLRVLEMFAPPPSQGTSGAYARTKPYLNEPRSTQDELLGHWPIIPYLRQQLAAGSSNGMQLWRDLRDHHGYRGSRAFVSRWIAQHRHLVPVSIPAAREAKRRGRPPSSKAGAGGGEVRVISARQAAWLLVRRPEALEDNERRFVTRLCELCPAVQTAYPLAQEFLRIARERHVDALEGWLTRAGKSGVREVGGFAAGLRQDQAAIAAALTLPFSNGQVEGQVNRLKLIKRSGYGRAKFDLLRHRVLAA